MLRLDIGRLEHHLTREKATGSGNGNWLRKEPMPRGDRHRAPRAGGWPPQNQAI